MAFQQSHSDQFRVTHQSAYWRLTGFNYDNFQQTATLVFSCYASKDAANAKMQPLASKSFTLVNQDYHMVNTLLSEGLKANAYEFAKQKPDSDGNVFFSEALNV